MDSHQCTQTTNHLLRHNSSSLLHLLHSTTNSRTLLQPLLRMLHLSTLVTIRNKVLNNLRNNMANFLLRALNNTTRILRTLKLRQAIVILKLHHTMASLISLHMVNHNSIQVMDSPFTASISNHNHSITSLRSSLLLFLLQPMVPHRHSLLHNLNHNLSSNGIAFLPLR
jgi:hypothetical protein